MGLWVWTLEIELLLIFYIVCCSCDGKLSKSNRFTDYVTLHDFQKRTQRNRLKNNNANYVSEQKTNAQADNLLSNDHPVTQTAHQKRRLTRSILNLNIESDEATRPNSNDHVIHAQYVRSDIFKAPILLRSSTVIKSVKSSLSTDDMPNKNHLINKNNATVFANNSSSDISSNHSSNIGQEIIRQFMTPTIKNDQDLVSYITKRVYTNKTRENTPTKLSSFFDRNSLINLPTSQAITDTDKDAYLFEQSRSAITEIDGHKKPIRKTEKDTGTFEQNRFSPNIQAIREVENDSFEQNRPSIYSFFQEEGNEDDAESSNFESNVANIESVYENIPIVSKLIQGTLNKDIERENEELRPTSTSNNTPQGIDSLAPDYDIMLDNYYKDKERKHDHKTDVKTNYHYMTESELERSKINKTRQHYVNIPMIPEITHNKTNETNKDETENTPASTVNKHTNPKVNKTYRDEIDITDLMKTYNKIQGEKQNNKDFIAFNGKRGNKNKIEFYNVNSSSAFGMCMDGSLPGYYLRRGSGNGKNKWIMHLHGGAWCYDQHSCLKRRKTILGSTMESKNADMRSFFHGFLSKNSKVNPNFYNWNVAVLSYCDGGLFSGNRKKSITGKGVEFYFQGQGVLRSLIKDLQEKRKFKSATDVILSGTSAGGLAVALQGDFIRNYIPKTTKVRGLIDASLFLDRRSSNGNNLARQQFKALYSLHRPILNKDCLSKFPKKDKYLCLFPQNSLPYLQLPVFIVNSLYDHWQLSYLEGVDCIYDDKRCSTKQHDEILSFRNQMYTTVNDIKRYKNDTGVFANSCIAHGQVILDYTWSTVKINHKNIQKSFYDWYNDGKKNGGKDFHTDCKYPCNGSCPRMLAQKCVANFIGASEHRRKRDAELC